MDSNSEDDNDNDNIGLVKIKKSYSVKFGVDVKSKEKEPHNDCIIQDRTRSRSHISFTYRPEMVPIIKPKQSTIKPSPMKLHKRRSLIDVEDDSMDCSENENNDKENEYKTLYALRLELMKIKMKVNKKETVYNEYESFVQTKINVNSSIYVNKENRIWFVKRKREMMWKKFINRQQHTNKSVLCHDNKSFLLCCNNSSNNLCKYNMNNSFSILNILENAAKERKILRKSNIY
jgi:hypothetical protein